MKENDTGYNRNLIAGAGKTYLMTDAVTCLDSLDGYEAIGSFQSPWRRE